MWTYWTEVDQIRPKWIDWTDQEQCELNETKVDRMDRIEQK